MYYIVSLEQHNSQQICYGSKKIKFHETSNRFPNNRYFRNIKILRTEMTEKKLPRYPIPKYQKDTETEKNLQK